MTLRAKSIISIGFLGLLCFLLPGSLRADDFTFSFTSTSGTVSGTVTGEILGLTNNATGPASEVLITSFPAGLNSVLGSVPINVSLWPPTDNSFTETNGEITSGDFSAYKNVDGGHLGGDFILNDNGQNFLELDGTFLANYVYEPFPVLASENFEPLVSSAPEPSTLLLLGTGLFALMGLAWRLNSQASGSVLPRGNTALDVLPNAP